MGDNFDGDDGVVEEEDGCDDDGVGGDDCGGGNMFINGCLLMEMTAMVVRAETYVYK